VATVADVSIAQVEESELERRFKVALRAWVERDTSGTVALAQVPGRGTTRAFEVSVTRGVEVMRYRFDEQPGPFGTPPTAPDFLIKRMDTSAPEIAVYLDGFGFHATGEHNRIADDAAKRAGVRSTGRLVWNLSWDDVEQFHQAVVADPPKPPPGRTMLDARAKGIAQKIQHNRDGTLPVTEVDRNPLDLLLAFLLEPDLDVWKRVARSVVGGLGGTAGLMPIDAPGLGKVLDAALSSHPVEPDAVEPAAAVVNVSVAETVHRLRLVLALDLADPQAERWTAIAVLPDGLDDVADPGHKARWTDWLAWANILQFLGTPENSTGTVVAASSQATGDGHHDLWLRQLATAGVVAPEPTGAGPALEPLDADLIEELSFVDDDIRPLVEAVIGRDGPRFVAGHETAEGLIVEAAFPDQKVGILLPGDDVPEGWDARPLTGWTADDLQRALGKAS
jgi:hypothetical protein